MQIDTAFYLPPVVAQLQAQFAELGPISSSGLPAPSDPFSVLLDAVSNQSSTSSASTSTGSTTSDGTGLTTSSVDPQIVSLASTSAASPVTAALSGVSASGSAIVGEASKFLGVPYVWGGSSPSGFDCSGLVQYVFSELGVELPRGSVDQSEVGTPVASLAQAQPGDLLFFEPGQNGLPPVSQAMSASTSATAR